MPLCACREGFQDFGKEKVINHKKKRGAVTAADVELGWPHTEEESLQNWLWSDSDPSHFIG